MIAEAKPFQKSGESVHAYDREGNPQHQVPYKDKKRAGEFRPTTLRDIKERGWLPSVSSILSIMAKKGLDGWVKEQAIHGAYEEILFGVPAANSFEDFLPRALERAESRMTRARDLGTEIHGAIANYLSVAESAQWEEAHPAIPYCEHVNAAISALKDLGAWGQPFSSERTFASPLGYGGTVDFRTDDLIADFKGVDSLTKKLAYPDRCSQLCGYSAGQLNLDTINESKRFSDRMFIELVTKPRLVNIFISTSEPGKYLIHEWSHEDKEQGWSLFSACFNLWKVANRYDPLAPFPSE